jgi:hypothetical protein
MKMKPKKWLKGWLIRSMLLEKGTAKLTFFLADLIVLLRIFCNSL